MTPDERESMEFLCQKIQSEQDGARFSELVDELNKLLRKALERRDGSTPQN